MPWYAYKLGGWDIAVDAINSMDAHKHIHRHAPGAKYLGEFIPPTWNNPSTATAMTTARRQEQISERCRKEMEEFLKESK